MLFKSSNIDITPEVPCRLTGMKPGERSRGLHSRLEINAMVFQQNDKKVFLISIDTLFINENLKNLVDQEISNCFGPIRDSDVVTTSTHSHYAPSLEIDRLALGQLDLEYYSFLKGKIADLIKLLKEEPFKEVTLEVAVQKTENLTSSRRRFARRLKSFYRLFVAMEPDLNAYKNEEIRMIRIKDAQDRNEIYGLIWSFPCHPTNLFDKTLLSAEFPGVMRNKAREKFSAMSLPIIYLPGFAGDVRAYPPKRAALQMKAMNIFQLSYPVKYYRFRDKLEYDGWIKTIEDSFWKTWGQLKEIKIKGNSLSSSAIRKDLSILGIKAKGIESIIFRKISLGSVLALYTISAEVVSAYSEMITEIASEDFVIFTGYADSVFGYLPTQKQIAEGGYESEGYFDSFLVSGNFNPEIERIVKSCMIELNKSL